MGGTDSDRHPPPASCCCTPPGGEVLTNASVREILDADSVHARNALQRLRDQGYLAQTGTRGGSVYVLAKVSAPAGLRLDQDGLEDVVLAIAAEGSVRNEDVRKRTGLDGARVLTLLTGPVDDGRLARHGQRRGAYYTLP